MRYLKTACTITAVWLSLATTAFAALDRIEEARELALSQLQLPLSAAGNVVIRDCNGCSPSLLPVDAQTQYQVGASGDRMSLKEFRKFLASRNRDELITVLYDTANNTVTRIILSPAE